MEEILHDSCCLFPPDVLQKYTGCLTTLLSLLSSFISFGPASFCLADLNLQHFPVFFIVLKLWFGPLCSAFIFFFTVSSEYNTFCEFYRSGSASVWVDAVKKKGPKMLSFASCHVSVIFMQEVQCWMCKRLRMSCRICHKKKKKTLKCHFFVDGFLCSHWFTPFFILFFRHHPRVSRLGADLKRILHLNCCPRERERLLQLCSSF